MDPYTVEARQVVKARKSAQKISRRADPPEVFSAESCTQRGISEPARSCQNVLSELKSQMTNLGKETSGHILAQQTGARGREEVKVNPEEILEGKAACPGADDVAVCHLLFFLTSVC